MNTVAVQRSLIASALAMCLLGCSNEKPPVETTIHHPNGLGIVPPPGFESQQTDAGFILRRPGDTMQRNPTRLHIELIRSDHRPAGDWPHIALVGDEGVPYRVDEVTEGSGGTEYSLCAWKPVPGGYILMEEDVQEEKPGSPDFSPGWNLMAHAQCATPAK